MIVSGYEVPQEAVRAVTERIRTAEGEFKTASVLRWFVEAGVPHWLPDAPYIASEAAARLLQFERKAGRVVFSRGVWRVRR
jgi:hypothetical protein